MGLLRDFLGPPEKLGVDGWEGVMPGLGEGKAHHTGMDLHPGGGEDSTLFFLDGLLWAARAYDRWAGYPGKEASRTGTTATWLTPTCLRRMPLLERADAILLYLGREAPC